MHKIVQNLVISCVQTQLVVVENGSFIYSVKLAVDKYPYLFSVLAHNLLRNFHTFWSPALSVICRFFPTIHTPYKETNNIYKSTFSTLLSGEPS